VARLPAILRLTFATCKTQCLQAGLLPGVLRQYNEEHRHSGLGLLSRAVVHYGLAPAAIEQRRAVLNAAYLAHPERFARKPPQPLPAPMEVWINKPLQTPENKTQ